MRTPIMLALVSSLLAALCPAARAADTRFSLTGAWPSGAAIDRIEGQEITYPSASPFSPADFADMTEAPKATARATLFLPPGKHKPRSLPAVIMLHGSGGVLSARELTYGRQLAAMGIAALAIDVFAARRELGRGFIDRLLNITESMMIADAYAGLHWLAETHPAIDPKRVVLAGFSYGAMASMYAMNARVAQQLGRGGAFAGHVAFYGPCIARFSDKRTTGAPLLFLYGTADILIDRARCEQFAADLREGGSQAEIISYEGAPHQWDGGWGRRTIGRTMHGCRLWVERDGTVRDLNTMLPMSTPLTRKIILGLCANGPPLDRRGRSGAPALEPRFRNVSRARVRSRGARSWRSPQPLIQTRHGGKKSQLRRVRARVPGARDNSALELRGDNNTVRCTARSCSAAAKRDGVVKPR